MRLPFFSRQSRLAKAPRRTSKLNRRNLQGFEWLEDRRVLATIPVTLASDAANPVNDGKITLREAITYVNTGVVPQDDLAIIDRTEPLGTNDKIIFNDALFDADGQLTINLTAPANNNCVLPASVPECFRGIC